MLWVKIFLFGCLVSSFELVPSTKLSTNAVAMVGIDSNPMLGEISPAHNWVLFLNKFMEFPRHLFPDVVSFNRLFANHLFLFNFVFREIVTNDINSE